MSVFVAGLEGSVQINLKDFDKLREQAASYVQLMKELSNCSTVRYIEEEDNFQQHIIIDQDKAKKIISEYALYMKNDDADILEDAIIKFKNEESEEIGKPVAGEYERKLLAAGYTPARIELIVIAYQDANVTREEICEEEVNSWSH